MSRDEVEGQAVDRVATDLRPWHSGWERMRRHFLGKEGEGHGNAHVQAVGRKRMRKTQRPETTTVGEPRYGGFKAFA